MKSENGVSSFCSESRIAKGSGRLVESSGSAISGFSSKEFSFGGSSNLIANIWSRMVLAFLSGICKNDPLEVVLSDSEVFLLRPL